MNSEIFDTMEQSQLKSYIEFLLWHYRVVDAFWFIYTEEQFGREAAEQINEKDWGKAAQMAAKGILRRFNIKEKWQEGFVKALKMPP